MPRTCSPRSHRQIPCRIGSVEDKCPDPVFEHIGNKTGIDDIGLKGAIDACEKFPSGFDAVHGLEHQQIGTKPPATHAAMVSDVMSHEWGRGSNRRRAQ